MIKRVLIVFAFILLNISMITGMLYWPPTYNFDGEGICESTSSGQLILTRGNTVRATGMNLEPYTYYTLIVFEGELTEDSSFTCIEKRQTTRNGNLKTKTNKVNYLQLMGDNKEQVFALVKSDDIECCRGRCSEDKFVSFNECEYLIFPSL